MNSNDFKTVKLDSSGLSPSWEIIKPKATPAKQERPPSFFARIFSSIWGSPKVHAVTSDQAVQAFATPLSPEQTRQISNVVNLFNSKAKSSSTLHDPTEVAESVKMALTLLAQKKEGKFKRGEFHKYSIVVTKDGNAFIHLKDEIGKGSFKTVKAALIILKSDQVIAGAKLTTHYRTNLDEKELAESEIKHLTKFLNKADSRIIQLFHSRATAAKSKIDMYEEFATQGSLTLEKYNAMSPDEKLQFVKELLGSLKEMKDNNVINSDIKFENILLDENNHVKLADFGLSVENNPKGVQSLGGTNQITAPEIFSRNGYTSFKADLFSAGIVLYLMRSGDTNFMYCDHLKGGGIRVKDDYMTIHNFLKRSSNPFDQMIAKMIEIIPEDRCTVEEAIAMASKLTTANML